ncbi:hypothetical protein BD413DRAFT_617291 [Trametes elegans]|nr:hypothetical protein BD413DRAFT_617291 [Trametes elegans]
MAGLHWITRLYVLGLFASAALGKDPVPTPSPPNTPIASPGIPGDPHIDPCVIAQCAPRAALDSNCKDISDVQCVCASPTFARSFQVCAETTCGLADSRSIAESLVAIYDNVCGASAGELPFSFFHHDGIRPRRTAIASPWLSPSPSPSRVGRDMIITAPTELGVQQSLPLDGPRHRRRQHPRHHIIRALGPRPDRDADGDAQRQSHHVRSRLSNRHARHARSAHRRHAYDGGHEQRRGTREPHSAESKQGAGQSSQTTDRAAGQSAPEGIASAATETTVTVTDGGPVSSSSALNPTSKNGAGPRTTGQARVGEGILRTGVALILGGALGFGPF